jgi:cytochrome c553
MRPIGILAGAVLGLACGVTLAAGNAERGKQKADQVCAACHAVGGDWNKPLQPEYPRLAGQHRDYLVTALDAYKRGDNSQVGRKNAIMAGQATGLSRQEIEDIAAFLSGLSGPLHVKHR